MQEMARRRFFLAWLAGCVSLLAGVQGERAVRPHPQNSLLALPEHVRFSEGDHGVLEATVPIRHGRKMLGHDSVYVLRLVAFSAGAFECTSWQADASFSWGELTASDELTVLVRGELMGACVYHVFVELRDAFPGLSSDDALLARREDILDWQGHIKTNSSVECSRSEADALRGRGSLACSSTPVCPQLPLGWVSVFDKEVGCDYFFNAAKNLGSWDSPPCHTSAETDPSPSPPSTVAQNEPERPFPSTPGSVPTAATALREIAGLQHPEDISAAIVSMSANEGCVAGQFMLLFISCHLCLKPGLILRPSPTQGVRRRFTSTSKGWSTRPTTARRLLSRGKAIWLSFSSRVCTSTTLSISSSRCRR